MKVLLADDTTTSLMITRKYISSMGHQSIIAHNGAEAVELFEREKPDLVLLDVEMPKMNGYEAAHQIKAICDNRGDWVPIIFLSGMIRDKDIAKGIEAGGDDYLTKPVSRMVLTAKLQAMQRISNMRHKLHAAYRELSKLSRLDGLTGIANRKYFNDTLEREWNRSIRKQAILSLVLCDIDHFKAYNDNYGHLAGDACLSQVAGALNLAVKRRSDLLGRYGGEEFAAILPDTDLEGATEVAHQMLSVVSELGLVHEHSPTCGKVTLSFGVASSRPYDYPDRTPNSLVDAADKALYCAKHQGRNRVESNLEDL
jgi:diguanylate cyclase (GGDEF)-like protein